MSDVIPLRAEVNDADERTDRRLLALAALIARAIRETPVVAARGNVIRFPVERRCSA
ncbi:hypothetical protein [Lysobacter capsici]|uniref:hypothetical protein n=1 Tax=Lysobacter capsici TaxID=435897 RepID=UPI001C005EB5|nr:hypothetical protein [Lysobacter capsici]QWF19308.1 hypothetical protein KME82_11485 [Lysobacter capsici]